MVGRPGDWSVPKSQLQKLYEKFAQINFLHDDLGVMVASDENGQHHVILVLRKEGGGGRPLAKLLTQNDIGELQPHNNTTLDLDFERAMDRDNRRTMAEFDAEHVMDEFKDGLDPDTHLD